MKNPPKLLPDDSDALRIDGFDRAILGHCFTWDGNECVSRLVYSGETIIDMLCENHDMTDEEAEEYCSFNIEGAYMGKHTPVISWPYNE